MSTHDEPIQPRGDSTMHELWHEADALRTNQQQDFDVFRAEMAAEFAAIRTTLDAAPDMPIATAGDVVASATEVTEDVETAEAAGDEQLGHDKSAPSRRTLFKWGGLGAAAALAAAGGATFTSQTAYALDGADLLLGSSTNKAEHVTTLTYNGTETTPQILKIVSTANDSIALYAPGGNQVSSAAAGVVAMAGSGASAYGAHGSAGADGSGLRGDAKGFSAYGIWGLTDMGYGVAGDGGSGIDLAALGTGRIQQALAGFAGAPTSGSFLAGEQLRDASGNLYICVTSGSPGTWKKVAALDTHYKGGGIVFLSTPIRVYDSRNTGGALIGNATRDVQITGVVIGGVEVPKGASGCIGNLTVTNPSASGYVVIYPEGSSTPTTSTVNFLTGQTVANAFSVGLSATGGVTVHSFTKGQCHFIVDINGFII